MYNTFECHFKPNQKLQSDMTDPVVWRAIARIPYSVNEVKLVKEHNSDSSPADGHLHAMQYWKLYV